MRNRLAPLALAVSVALLAGPGLVTAAPGEVVNGGMPLVATGKVVAKSADSLVVRTDDHAHRITFAVDRSTAMPEDLKAGQHVRVVYHATGTTGQTADKVTVEAPQRATR